MEYFKYVLRVAEDLLLDLVVVLLLLLLAVLLLLLPLLLVVVLTGLWVLRGRWKNRDVNNGF